jgi:transcriptional regulator with XRE-family HTH domain|nr:MAG TPA: helix-turn-helix domain protein [Caudoviricetes sp.]
MIIERLIQLRENKQLKQIEVAKLLNIGTVTYNRYEKGEREPDHKMLNKIANFFNVSTDYLLGLTDIPYTVDDYIAKQKKAGMQPVDNQYSADEQELVNMYRDLPYEGQVTVKSIAKTQHDLYVKPKCDKKAI